MICYCTTAFSADIDTDHLVFSQDANIINSYPTQLQITAGTITLTADNALGTAPLLLVGGQVDLAGYALSNSSLALIGGSLENSNINNTITYSNAVSVGSNSTINGAGNLIFSGAVTHNTSGISLTKDGTGTLTLSGNLNQVTRDINIAQGKLVVGNSNANTTLASTLSGGGTLEKVGTRRVGLTKTNSSFSGPVIITAGTLLNSSNDSLGTGPVTIKNGTVLDFFNRSLANSSIILDGGTLSSSSETGSFDYLGDVSVTQNSTFSPNPAMTLSGALSNTQDAEKITVDGGLLWINGDVSNFNADIDLVFEGGISLQGSTNQTLVSRIVTSDDSTGGLNLYSFGSWTLAGTLPNTYKGTTSLEAGTLILGKDSALGTGQLLISASTLDVAGFQIDSSTILMIAGAVMQNSSTNSAFHYNDTLTIRESSVFEGDGDFIFNGLVDIKRLNGNPITKLTKNGSGTLTFAGTLISNINSEIEINAGALAVTPRSGAATLADVTVKSGGVLDISVIKEQDVTPEVIVISNLIMQDNAELVLRPDLTSTHLDPELVLIDLFSVQPLSTIRVQPQNLNAPVPQERFNLLRLGTNINNDENRNTILSLLTEGNLYELQEPMFSLDGVLSCGFVQLVQQLSQEVVISKVPSVYQSFINKLFNNSSSNSLVYNTIANSSTDQDLIDNVRAFSPIGALPTSLYQSLNTTTTQNVTQAHRHQSIITNLVGKNAYQAHAFFEKISNLRERGYKNAAVDQPGPQIESFRVVNLDGFSFESQLQYQYQKEPNRTEDLVGYSSHTWATLLGVSYSSKNHYSIGTMLATSKTNEKMNLNNINKDGSKTDRKNSASLVGYYRLNDIPVTISGLMTYGQHNYSQLREWRQTLEDGAEQLRAMADYKAYETVIQTEIGYTYTYSEKLSIQPFISGAWTHTKNTAYQEKAEIIQSGVESLYGYLVPEQSYSAASYSAGLELIGAGHISDTEALLFMRLGVSTQKNNGE